MEDNPRDVCRPVVKTGFLPYAIPIAGLEHVTSNLTEEIHTQLGYWQRFWTQLHNLSLLLTRRWRRERFLYNCIQGTAVASHAHELEGWSATLYQSRWREVIRFVRKMLPVWPLLRCFTALAYRAGADGGEDDAVGVHDLMQTWQKGLCAVRSSLPTANLLLLLMGFPMSWQGGQDVRATAFLEKPHPLLLGVMGALLQHCALCRGNEQRNGCWSSL